MIELLRQYWPNYLYSDGFNTSGLAITLWLLVVSIIGLADVVKAAQDAGKATQAFFFFTLVTGAIYLAITTVSNLALHRLEKRYSTGVRRAAL